MRLNPDALDAIRQRSGLSVSALAELAGVQRAHMSNILAGRRTASDEAIVAVSAGLKVPVTAIICDPEPNDRKSSA